MGRRLQIGLLATLMTLGCTIQPPQPRYAKEYEIVGQVVSVDTNSTSITIAHQAIPGLMGAMTMTFRAQNRQMLLSIQAGDEVAGRLKSDGINYILAELAVTKKAAAEKAEEKTGEN